MVKPTRMTYPTGSKGLYWQVTDDGSRTLWDERLNETYHSGSGAVMESWEVYLKNSGVYERLKQGKATAVLEYGFGTGTNFLLTAAAAILNRVPLYYRALELSVLPSTIFAELQLNKPCLETQLGSDCTGSLDTGIQDTGILDTGIQNTGTLDIGVLNIAQQLVAGLASWRATLAGAIAPGIYTYKLEWQIELELVVGDAATYRSNYDRVDAVYFDPFSPVTCPTLWTRGVFELAFHALNSGGTLTSYCVKSAVRRELEQVGFIVERLKGPTGGKREVLRALKPTT